MIYEIRTYDIKPGSLAEVEKRFGEAYETRKSLSPLAAFWHTEIGPLNQIIHVWPYENLEERARIRAAAVKDKVWPPDIGEFVVRMQSDIMMPFAISPANGGCDHAPSLPGGTTSGLRSKTSVRHAGVPCVRR